MKQFEEEGELVADKTIEEYIILKKIFKQRIHGINWLVG